MSERAGKLILQPAGYKAFIPNPLPPEGPQIEYDDDLRLLLSNADRKISKLEGITSALPNPDLFLAMYVKKEALLSSQIEGTQASLEGVLEFEADLEPKDNINEIKEVVNYVKAINYGTERIKGLPVSLRLIRELHGILLEGARGGNKDPGEFRKTQNWIGLPGGSLKDAVFIPPPPDAVIQAMGDLEKFLYAEDSSPLLVKIGLVHAQFETIHPFLDGNGRIGRLIIALYLIWKGVLSKPLLYLSYYLKKNRGEYYERLAKIRAEGAWEAWLKFFLRGVGEISGESADTAREIIRLKENLASRLRETLMATPASLRFVDLIFDLPVISAKDASEKLGVSKETSTALVRKFAGAGILKEITGKRRYRKYLFTDYVDIIRRGTV